MFLAGIKNVQLQGWEIALLACAAFIAVTALVRLMRLRRDELMSQLLRQAEEEHRQKSKAERKAQKKEHRSA